MMKAEAKVWRSEWIVTARSSARLEPVVICSDEEQSRSARDEGRIDLVHGGRDGLRQRRLGLNDVPNAAGDLR